MMQRRKYIQALAIGGVSTGLAVENSSAEEDIKRKVEMNNYSIDSDAIEADIWVDDNAISKDSTAEIGFYFDNISGNDLTLSQECSNSVNSIEGTRDRGNVDAILVGKLNTWQDKNGRWFVDEDELYPDRPNRQMTTTLAEGESYRMQYQIWGRRGGPYLPPRTYNFERDITIDGDTNILSIDLDILTD